LKRLAPSRNADAPEGMRRIGETYEELVQPLENASRLGEIGGSLPIQPHGGINLTCCNLISSIKMK
jgi:hypothetical protein